jgi:uncharacterized protein
LTVLNSGCGDKPSQGEMASRGPRLPAFFAWLYGIRMRFAEDETAGRYRIRAYAPGKVTINEAVFTRSLVVTPGRILADWQPQSFDELQAEHLILVADLAPEIILLGTGAMLRFPRPAVAAPLIDSGIGLEVMDTAAACRTYKILVSEDRQVAAALIIG